MNLLDALSLLVVQIRDRLARVVIELRKQSTDVLDGMQSLRGLDEGHRKRFDERFQSPHQAVDQP